MSTPNPIPSPGAIANPEQYAEYMKAITAEQANTTGLTQVAPGGQPMGPSQMQMQQPGEQQNRVFGPGQGGAHKIQSMQNLVKASQQLAGQIGQIVQERRQRQYQQVIGRYEGTVQGIGQAQAQIQQGQQIMQQAAAALKANPNDANAHQKFQQGQQMMQSGQLSLKTNQQNLNDMANDPKAHKVITKAYGIDDKNASSPERQALIQQWQQKMGINPNAAAMISQMPQTQQLSPQAQAQQEARQAGVVGAPASAGQILSNVTRMTTSAAHETGMSQRAQAHNQLQAALNGQTYDPQTGELRSMTPQEIAQHPLIQAKLDVSHARQQVQEAQAALEAARTTALPEQVKMLQARVATLQGNLMMRQKEFGIKVQEEERKQLETAAKIGQADTLTTPDGGKVDLSKLTGGRPLQSWAQQTVVTAQDRLTMVDGLINRIKDLKLEDNNTPGYLAADRLGYAFGYASPDGELGSEISNIELQEVVNAATILKGSSRAYAALSLAMVHTPNAWVDSPKLMYNKLQMIRQNLLDMQRDAIHYGQKNQRSTEMPEHPADAAGAPSHANHPAATPPAASADDPMGILH